MKISIIGTNGFLSTHIAAYALECGHRLKMFGRRVPYQHEYDEFVKVDLAVENLVCEQLLDSEMIIYSAGAGIQSSLSEDADTIYKLNVFSPIQIFNKLKLLGYDGIIISFGSYFEIGNTEISKPFTEKEIITSNGVVPNDYSVSKRLLTRFVSSYKHSYVHWHFILPTIYGAGENQHRLIPYIVNAIRSRTMMNFTSGKQKRQYLHVDDIPPMLFNAMTLELPSGVYNIAGCEVYSVRQLVYKVCETLNYNTDNCRFGCEHRSDIDMSYLALDGDLLKKSIGFQSKTTISDKLVEYGNEVKR